MTKSLLLFRSLSATLAIALFVQVFPVSTQAQDRPTPSQPKGGSKAKAKAKAAKSTPKVEEK